MSDLSYMIWFLATAAMTIIVLTVGTLAAAAMLPGGQYGSRTGATPSGVQQHPAPERRAA